MGMNLWPPRQLFELISTTKTQRHRDTVLIGGFLVGGSVIVTDAS